MKDRKKTDQMFLENLLSNTSTSGEAVAAQSTSVSQPSSTAHSVPFAQGYQRVRRLPKIRGSSYEKLMHKMGVLVGFMLAGGMWYSGAFFTMQWLSSLGFAVNFGISAWWLIPVAVTSFEVGLQTAKHPAALLVWFLVLAFDILTTSIGLHHFASARGIAMPALEFWVLSSLIGFEFALAPERLGRVFYIELMR